MNQKSTAKTTATCYKDFSLIHIQKDLIDWNKTIELDSNLIYPWFNKGNLNFFLKNYSDAIDDYTRAIELNSNFALAYYNRGINKDSIGDLSGACEDWKVAVSLGDEEAKKWITDKCN